MDFVVPFAMKLVSLDVNLLDFFVAYLATFVVFLCVKPRMHFESFSARCGANEAGDNLKCFERNSLPVAGDMTEQPMLNLVPLTCPPECVNNFETASIGI